MAIGIALLLEMGAVSMAHPNDDTYEERKLPQNNAATDFLTPAFGAALRIDGQSFVLTGGWRSLGTQTIRHAGVEPDVQYYHCQPTDRPVQVWDSSGSESQFYASIGRKFGNFVPTVGMGVNRISWGVDHITMLQHSSWDFLVQRAALGTNHGATQERPNAFIGVDYERGVLGVGLYLLGTRPYTQSNVDPYFPAQGPVAAYFRVTYRVGL